jgi:hypothetical protein
MPGIPIAASEGTWIMCADDLEFNSTYSWSFHLFGFCHVPHV